MARRGWRRLWVVATVLWVAWMAWQIGLVAGATWTEILTFGLAWAVGPPAIVYLIGLVAAWLVRGFRESVDTGPLAR